MATSPCSATARGGNDTLLGGDGNDNFRFDTPLNAATNVDTLSDFVSANDTIQLATAVTS